MPINVLRVTGWGGQVVLESEKSGRTDFRVLEGLLSNQFPTLVS